MKRLALALAFMSIFLTGSLVTPAQATVHPVHARHDRFHPKTFHASVGDVVVWDSYGDLQKHSVTAISGHWHKDVVLRPDNQTEHTFRHAGIYVYRCKFHRNMTGTITVA